MQCPHIIALTRQWSLRNPLLRMNRFERYRGLFSKWTLCRMRHNVRLLNKPLVDKYQYWVFTLRQYAGWPGGDLKIQKSPKTLREYLETKNTNYMLWL